MFYHMSNEGGFVTSKIKDAYKKRYKMRVIGKGGLNILVSLPTIVIEREAERRGLTIREFVRQFRAVAQFDNFEGVLYTFEETKKE